ncbi:FAD-dependent oxidoreductase [Actinoalloteichus spitiensis]|uniref:FAD-dependent oxidoreductase n=1 Tax=Actinoalloteichus spitiensis TaxID=252394 RepID=UPI0003614592|nr:FAD-dependent oxidoreductase [Actinoalloteichus spitiensis]
MKRTNQLVVVGAGVIGSAVAWHAATSGWSVVVVGPEPAGTSSSWVAGGMLAPVAEAWPGEEISLRLGSASLESWPAFASAVSVAAGGTADRAPGGALLSAEGGLLVGVDGADRADLERLARYLAARGREVTALSGREARSLEPSLGPAVRHGLHVPGDLAVDNRRLLWALRAAARSAGAVFDTGWLAEEARGGRVLLRRATRNGPADPPPPGLPRTEDGERETRECDVVVLAAGAWSSRLHPRLGQLIRPVKGEVVRLAATPGSLPPPRRTVRGSVRGRTAYLVPRDGGRLVVGASQRENGFDTSVTAGAVRELLTDAGTLVPALDEYEITETIAGLRPGSPDNVPLVGPLEPGLLVASGHHRNGFLLTPVTVELVGRLLGLAGAAFTSPSTDTDELLSATDPARFTTPTGTDHVGEGQ